MSDKRSLEAVEKLQLINAADDMRLAADPFKLDFGPPTSLKSLVTARLGSLLAGCAGTAFAAGNEASAQEQFRTATDKLKAAHRGGFRWIDSQLPDSIPQPDPLLPPHMSAFHRANMMEVYLFEGGEVGDFTDLRTLDMARQVPAALGLAMPNPAWHYPQSLVDHISLQLATAESAQTIAEGGDTSVAIDVRNGRADLADAVIARVRFKYCGATDEGDATVELRKIGMKPRGSGGTGGVPGAAGPAVYDAVAKTLTVSALPADSISIRAYRKLLPDGDTELCGVSISPVVSIAQATPLQVADYEVWVVGFDGDDEGPESPHITVDNTP